MSKKEISTGAVHRVPKDLKSVLDSNPAILILWNKLTPLARNEWICWITIVKKKETRAEHLERLCVDLKRGKTKTMLLAGLSSS